MSVIFLFVEFGSETLRMPNKDQCGHLKTVQISHSTHFQTSFIDQKVRF
ncbi:hypothetical protein VCHA27O13_60027 [Vibrio chagasii]|nr:hypothetical protein VCHA27O13_60027 [Vibrio chagasii]